MSNQVLDLTRDWGSREAVTLYLDRCQVDTPQSLVSRVWQFVAASRVRIGTVLDLGAGDARFAREGAYEDYIGVEIDPSRVSRHALPPNARLVHQCAFEAQLPEADVCVGNPPYVRNQDLPEGWRQRAASVIRERTGIQVSGLANAWQYFMFLALASTKADGLVALVIPFEWVSRPSAAALRRYVEQEGWSVSCYRLLDRTFDHVLTTCSITIVDKRSRGAGWRYFQEVPSGEFEALASPSGEAFPLNYQPVRGPVSEVVRVRRGLSPGTQRWLVLTEPERARNALRIGRDVVPCVQSLRVLGEQRARLTPAAFEQHYRGAGVRCWLIRTDHVPSRALIDYLDSVPVGDRDTVTCNARTTWWQFVMPEPPAVLVSSGFRGAAPKVVVNEVGARAVGAVSGIYGLSRSAALLLRRKIRRLDLRSQIVAHSNGLRKVEIGQLQALIDTL
jgi:hypothetical protein